MFPLVLPHNSFIECDAPQRTISRHEVMGGIMGIVLANAQPYVGLTCRSKRKRNERPDCHR